MRHTCTLLFAAIMSIGAIGCTDDPASPGGGLITLSGTVVELRNDFPLDGGAEIQLRDDADDQIRRAYVPSLFVRPTPDQETQATVARVMAVFHELKVGDHAVARGVPDEGGLRMEYLEAR